MMKEAILVTCGGNLDTYRNVLVALRERLKKSSIRITKVLMLIDGASSSDVPDLNGYSAATLALLTEAEFRSRLASDIQATVPGLLVSAAKECGRSAIVVDLTSGTKTASAVLYACASFLKLTHLYYVRVIRQEHGFPRLWELHSPEGHYEVVPLRPLGEVDGLASQCQFDLLYYSALIDRLEEDAQKLGIHQVMLPLMQLRNSLAHFFGNPPDYLAAMQSIGNARESIAEFALTALSRVSSVTPPTKTSGLDDWATAYRKQDPGAYGRVPGLLVIDFFLQGLRHWRNSAMHKAPVNFQPSDVRIALLLSLRLIETFMDVLRIAECEK